MTVMNQEMQALTSSESVEWYTPPHLIELVREVLGTISLDPCSASLPQSWIKASTYWTVENSDYPVPTLQRPWFGKVFMNPPYGKTGNRSNQDLWMQKLITDYRQDEVESAIALINARLGYPWFERIWRQWPVCMVRDLISFIKEDGTVGGKAKSASCFVLLPKDDGQVGLFEETFSTIGRILVPDDFSAWPEML